VQIPKIFLSGNWNARLTVTLGLSLTVGYVLLFTLCFPRFGAILASLAVLPVTFIGWRMGLRAGLATGLLSLPLNLLLFKLAGVNGIDTLMREGGGLGTFIIVLLGAAAGWVHDAAEELSKQIRINKTSEERFRSLLDGVPMGIYRTTPEGKILDANRALLALLGYREKGSFLSTNVKDLFVDRNDRAAWKTQIESREIIRGFEVQLRRADGSTFWVEDNASLVRDEDGNVAYYEGSLHDITDRKQMEAALRQGEERYQGLFEHSPVSLWEEDFSRVKKTVDQWRDEGVRDFDVYFDNHPEAVAKCLAMIRVIDVNYATLNLYGAGSKDELLNNLDKVFTENTYEIFRQEILTIAEGRTVFEGVGKNCTLTGDTIDIHLRWSVAPGYEDSLSKVFVSIVDITERERAKERLQRQTTQAEALAEISKALSAAGLEAQAIFDLIAEHTANLVGDACVLRLIGEDSQSIRVVAFHHRDPNLMPLMQQLVYAGPRQIGNGAAGRVAKTGRPLFLPTISPEGTGVMLEPEYEAYLHQTGVHSLLVIPLTAQGQVIGTLEISRHHPGDAFTDEDKSFLQNLANQAALTIVNARLHELVRHQARVDALTGVYNRRHFIHLAELEFSRSERYGKSLSIILLDLDHFKDINDTYGHHTGDQVLKCVAERCQANIRSADIMGRYGGEEFTILLPETNLLAAHYLAERLRTHIAGSPVDLGRDLIYVTVSLGIASNSEDTPDLAALLHQADQAMYVGKRAGRNQVALVH
jgi:diguanylate cyclase (GGDEF)-like protein/PAS domain S-box-containing protein